MVAEDVEETLATASDGSPAESGYIRRRRDARSQAFRILAAVYMDGGFESCKEVIKLLYQSRLSDRSIFQSVESKFQI